jgi:antitoxin VapB
MNEHRSKSQLNIKSERAYRAALELSGLTGESMTSAVTAALEEKLDRERRRQPPEQRPLTREERIAALMDIGRRYSELPLSGLTEDEILDYDEYGVPRNR